VYPSSAGFAARANIFIKAVNFFLHPFKPSWLYAADNPEPSLRSVVFYLDKDNTFAFGHR
jgi:hypothetical protein